MFTFKQNSLPIFKTAAAEATAENNDGNTNKDTVEPRWVQTFHSTNVVFECNEKRKVINFCSNVKHKHRPRQWQTTVVRTTLTCKASLGQQRLKVTTCRRRRRRYRRRRRCCCCCYWCCFCCLGNRHFVCAEVITRDAWDNPRAHDFVSQRFVFSTV